MNLPTEWNVSLEFSDSCFPHRCSLCIAAPGCSLHSQQNMCCGKTSTRESENLPMSKLNGQQQEVVWGGFFQGSPETNPSLAQVLQDMLVYLLQQQPRTSTAGVEQHPKEGSGRVLTFLL